LEYQEGDFPHAEVAAHESLALPIYQELTEDQQRFVAKYIKSFFAL
jgi:dTDP-4-amino-4,6-dideoxygalactose transaminase